MSKFDILQSISEFKIIMHHLNETLKSDKNKLYNRNTYLCIIDLLKDARKLIDKLREGAHLLHYYFDDSAQFICDVDFLIRRIDNMEFILREAVKNAE